MEELNTDDYDEGITSQELQAMIDWRLEKAQLKMQVLLLDSNWYVVNERLEDTPARIERRKLVQEVGDGRIITISESRGADRYPYWVRCTYPDYDGRKETVDYFWGPEGRPNRIMKDTIIRSDGTIGQRPESISMPGFCEGDIEHIDELLSAVYVAQMAGSRDYLGEFWAIAKRVDMEPNLVSVAAEDEDVINLAKFLDSDDLWEQQHVAYFNRVVKRAKTKYCLSHEGVLRAISAAQGKFEEGGHGDEA